MKLKLPSVLLVLCGWFSGGVACADEGWFRVGKSGNRHHLVSPSGDRFFALGVNHINALSQATDGGVQVRGRSAWEAYWDGTLKPQFDDWNLTTLGYGAPVELRSKAPWFATIGLAPIEKHRSDPNPAAANGYRFPDVFDPVWAKKVTERIRKAAEPNRNDPLLVGYFWTDTPTWDLQKSRALRGTEWVTAIRNLPPGSPGRDAYTSFLQKRYSNRLRELNEYYGLDLSSLDELATASLEKIAIGRHVVQGDDNAFLALIAKRFYQVVGSAQRQADPHHLVFGDRYLAGDAPVSVLKAATPWIDAVAVQPGDRYSPLYPASTAFPADEIEALHRVTGKPVLICDHAISFPTQAQPRAIFEQMPDESSAVKATTEFLRDAFSRPYTIGYLRCQYIDRPARFGRGLRQGLLRPDGRPREALVDAYRAGFAKPVAEVSDLGASGLKESSNSETSTRTENREVADVPSHVKPVAIPDAKPRNVVFILSDDHRYDAMSFMGHQLAETPRMDAMAKNGVHLKNAFVTTSLCSPSRASILTGLYTFRHRVIDNQRRVPDGTLFFPQYLQKAGYKTGFVGKWHMGHASDEPRPGFDYWVSFKGQGHYLPPNPKYTLNVNGQRVKQNGYITTELTRYALDFLKQQEGSDTPFMLYLSHKAVHGDFVPEEKYRGKFADKPFKLPASSRPVDGNKLNRPRWLLDQRNSWHGMDFPLHSDESVERIYKAYCEALCSVDDSIGAVLDQLKAMGIHDETLVIYMGDNGYMFGEHGLIDKRVAYETSSRVPMLMQCPDLFAGGTIVDEVVANIDIAPTIMDAMGLKKPAHMDGQSFLPLAAGKKISWRDYFLYVYYWEPNYPQTPTHFSLRGDRFKYTTYYGLWDTDELFDIQADPIEQNNLIHDPKFAKQKTEMQSGLYDMMEQLGGMQIPLNMPRGRQQNKRLLSKGVHGRSGEKAADFPEAMIVDEPLREIIK